MRSKAGAVLRQKGSVLMIVLILMALLASIPIMMQLTTTNQKSSQVQLSSVAQANNMARAGLLDAENWFRRQPIQPVADSQVLPQYPDAAFQPVISTNTTQSDTMDANIGIVQQYQIDTTGLLWGRYEVHKATVGTTYPADASSVHDISNLRIAGAVAGAGSVWYIQSTGYIYKSLNPAVPFNQPPNVVLGSSKISTEIRRVTLSLPAEAATVVNAGANPIVKLVNNGQINGGTAYTGIAYYGVNSGSLIVGGGAPSGTPPTQYISTGAINPVTIFGMSGHDLSLLADYSVTNVGQLPTQYPAQAIVYVNGNAVFMSSGVVNGGGILYVNGNLTFPTSGNVNFAGAIYTTGTALITGPALISGCVMVGSTAANALTVTGAGDSAQLVYNNPVIIMTQQQVAQYRESRSEYYTFTAFK